MFLKERAFGGAPAFSHWSGATRSAWPLHGKASAASQPPNPARTPQQNDGFEDKIRDNSRVLMYEKLVRKVLSKPKHPAVAMMQVSITAARSLCLLPNPPAACARAPHGLQTPEPSTSPPPRLPLAPAPR